jgi:hypothetical protein
MSSAPRQQLAFLGLMQSSSLLLLMSIVNDLLDYTKIQAGKLQFEYILFDLRDILKGCQQSVKAKTTERDSSCSASQYPWELPSSEAHRRSKLVASYSLLNLVKNVGLTMVVMNAKVSTSRCIYCKELWRDGARFSHLQEFSRSNGGSIGLESEFSSEFPLELHPQLQSRSKRHKIQKKISQASL